jgi:hypothetical protein
MGIPDVKLRYRAIAAALISAALACGCGEAQMGADPETFKAVDAFYTAVSLREPDRVDHCLETLTALRESGKLDREPFDDLNAIATEAKSGSWEPAQSRLARFMRGQTRGR